MELYERIKACRQRAGFTQEQVSDAMGVSRQAVTKWENGKSAPSTENLFKLAELFGTTVDMLLTEGVKAKYEKDLKRRKRIRLVLVSVVSYLLLFLLGFAVENLGLVERKYLVLWLLSSGAFQVSFVANLVFIFVGWNRTVLSLDAACLVGLLAGEVFGPNPAGASMGFGHYGWAIWIGVMLFGLLLGLLLDSGLLARKANDA